MAIHSMPKVIPGQKIKKQRYIPFKEIFLSLFLLAVVSAIIYVFIYSPVFKIKEIEISALEGIKKEEVLDLIKKEAQGKNIFLFKGESLKKEISTKYPLILNVLIFKGLPSTLKVVFQETRPVLNWETNKKVYLVDEKGRIIKEGQNNKLLKVVDSKNIEVKQGAKIIPISFIDFFEEFNNEAIKKGLKISYFEIGESLFDINVYLDNGIKLMINSNREPSETLSQYSKAIELVRPKEYIDLRFSHRAFVK